MDPRLLAIVSLRALGQLFSLQGVQGHKQAEALSLIANAIQSGDDMDAHMQAVADALESGDAASWDDIHARITAEAAELRQR